MSGVIVIAEAGPNHNGKISLARKLIDMAKDCGADFIKFQTSRPFDSAHGDIHFI